jgi:hypothetical protein
MSTIKSLLEKFQALDTGSIIDESLNETRDDFEKANIEQLRAGQTNDGSLIVPDYMHGAYAKKKNAMNSIPPFGTPDLILTGSFTSQLNAIVEGESIREFSNDEKGPELEKKYKNIFGLGKDFKKDYLVNNLGPSVQEKISNFTGLKFQ